MPDLAEFKFKENGDFNIFRGNTVVANLFHQNELMEMVNLIQSEYRKLPFIDKFTLTPNGSIHMTVIELLCDKNRLPDYWSKNLSLDLPIEQVSEYFGECLSEFPLTNEKIVMRTLAMTTQNIWLEPADEKSSERLKQIRESVSKATGVRFPNHDNYQYHISVGYSRVPLTEDEKVIFEGVKAKLSKILVEKLPTITIDRVDYTIFDDMTKFTPYAK